MKKFISLFIVMVMAFSLCACDGAPAGGTAPGTAQPEGTAGLANPVHDVTVEGLLAATGIILNAPERVENVSYSYIDQEGGSAIAQLMFTLDGVSCSYRAVSADVETGEKADISGMYYDWSSTDTAEVSYCSARLSWIEGQQGCISWYDYAPGMLYCLSVDSGASKAALCALAGELFVPAQGESDGTDLQTTDFQPVSVKDAGSLSADLDGDGADDTVEIAEWMVDEQGSGQYGFGVYGSSGLTVVWDELYVASKPVLWLADVDGDGRPEILFSGDTGSDDYSSACFKWDGATLSRIYFDGYANGFADGCVEAVNGGVITIGAFNYVLGTYGGVRDFALNNGAIAPVAGSIWVFQGSETWLTVKKPLPVTMGDTASLPVGTEILITGFDGVGTVYFTTRDGVVGTMSVEKNDSYWGWMIGGAAEEDCFESLPYAG